MRQFASPDLGRSSTLLTVPGLCCSGLDHWQTKWEETRPTHCRRIELPDWDDPAPGGWVAGIADAVARCNGYVVLAAHSLGCHAVAHWSLSAAPDALERIWGALLVAPPDVEARTQIRRSRASRSRAGHCRFGRCLSRAATIPGRRSNARTRWLASGREVIDVGRLGHINADSGIGDWPTGRLLVEELGTAGQSR